MKIYGLIGKSLDHSWSEVYFKDKFIRENITGCAYRNFPLISINDLLQLVSEENHLSGLNITIPYKAEVIQYLDRIEPLAASIGSVNCVKIIRSGSMFQLVGYNTDMAAFRDTLRPLLQMHHKRALVLGSGGASRSVCHALSELGIEYQQVSRRKSGENLTYGELNRDIIADHTLIINATPCGMYPDLMGFPVIPYEYMSQRYLCYDLIYNPEETKFLQKAGQYEATIKNGLEMLQLQAELSWKTWNKI